MTALVVNLALLGAVRGDCADEPRVRVTVVVVLATSTNNEIDPKLAELAKEIKKLEPKLTGFRRAATEVKSIPVGESATVPLVDKQELKLRVERPKDANGRISLTIKPPGMGEISYACTCDKFFPVATPYETKKGEQLIIAVMAKPCTAKK